MATARPFLLCCSTLSESVFIPLKHKYVSKAEEVPPRKISIWSNFLYNSSSFTAAHPITTSLWPFIYLVQLSIQISTPWSRGLKLYGLKKVLSTATRIFLLNSFVIFTTSGTSTTDNVGFVGDSIYTILTFSLSNDLNLFKSLKSKNVNFKLLFLDAYSLKFLCVPPYKSFIEIISSPGFNNKRQAEIAAIPLEKTTEYFPFSKDAMHLSRAFLVGWPKRVYIHLPKGAPGTAWA